MIFRCARSIYIWWSLELENRPKWSENLLRLIRCKDNSFKKTWTWLSSAKSYWCMQHRDLCLSSWRASTGTPSLIWCNCLPQLWKLNHARLPLSKCLQRLVDDLKDSDWFPEHFLHILASGRLHEGRNPVLSGQIIAHCTKRSWKQCRVSSAHRIGKPECVSCWLLTLCWKKSSL